MQQQMGSGGYDPQRQMTCGFLSPKKPQLQPVTRMPDQQDPATLEAQRVKQQQIMQRSGRTSTMLTNGGNSGGSAYSNSLLGQS